LSSFSSKWFDALFYLIVFPLTFTVFFVWIGRTVGTLIRLDYLRKDIIGWKKARPLYWLVVVLFFVLFVINPGNLPNLGYLGIVNPIITTISDATGILIVPILLILLAYASITLIVGSIRTRDLTFRNHAKWLGFAIGGLLAGFVLGIFLDNEFLFFLGGILFAYCFSRTARSLVPVNKL
jgi:hypothetical protein